MIRLLILVGFILLPFFQFAQNKNARFLLQRTKISVKNNRLIKELYYEIEILNHAGEKYSKIRIPYSSLTKVSKIKAYIKDSNNKIVRKLKKREIIEKNLISDYSFYEDNYIKEFTLKHNSYPYKIVYSYKVQQKEFLYIDFWTPVLYQEIPTLKAELDVNVPLNYKIQYKNQNIEKPIIDTVKDVISYRWYASYESIIKPEIFAPPLSNVIPFVSIVPEKFNYEIQGSFKSWVAYGNWQNNLLEGLNELPDYEKTKLLTLIKNIKDDKEKIKLLYHYLQDETRYVNISIETGGMKPYPATYVAKNKYGDCKALTNYFKSILDYIKIPSYYVNIYAGKTIKKIDKNFPSQQFNHAILYIPLNGEDIWLDCTSKAAFNYLGTFTQNRNGFVIKNNNSYFIKTPQLKPNDVLNKRKIEIEYDIHSSSIKFQNSYKGDYYENILYLGKKYNEQEKLKIFRDNLIDEGMQITKYQIENQNRDSTEITLFFQATSNKIYKHYGDDILVKNISMPIPKFERPEFRKQAVQIDYPLYNIDTLVYEIPTGYKLVVNQKNYSVTSRFGEFKVNISMKNKKVRMVKSLLINSGFYPISEYNDFYNFYNRIIDLENNFYFSFYK